VKKLIAMLLLGGFIAASVVGCGPTPSGTGTGTKPPVGDKPKDSEVKKDKDAKPADKDAKPADKDAKPADKDAKPADKDK
jgi:hypothetical protein